MTEYLMSASPRRLPNAATNRVGLAAASMTASEEGTDMTAVYTWDVFSTLDGYGSYAEGGGLGRLLGQAGSRAARAPRRPVRHRAADGLRSHHLPGDAGSWSSGIDPNTLDEWNVRTMRMPATVVSSTLHDTLGWPDATIESGDAVDIVARLKEESDVPLRSQASLSLNWAGMAAGRSTACR